MRARTLVAVAILVGATGCDSPRREPSRAATPSPTAAAAAALTAADLRAYLAVRRRALQMVEEALAAGEGRAEGPAAALPDLAEAERAAAAALGVDVRRYLWVRDRTARVLALQRQAEDRRMLVAELTRTQGDLLSQLAHTTDPASREFLQAQVRSIDAQLAKLRKELGGAPEVEAEAALAETVRVELAVLHSREERVQERLRQLVRRASEGGEERTRGTPDSP